MMAIQQLPSLGNIFLSSDINHPQLRKLLATLLEASCNHLVTQRLVMIFQLFAPDGLWRSTSLRWLLPSFFSPALISLQRFTDRLAETHRPLEQFDFVCFTIPSLWCVFVKSLRWMEPAEDYVWVITLNNVRADSSWLATCHFPLHQLGKIMSLLWCGHLLSANLCHHKKVPRINPRI